MSPVAIAVGPPRFGIARRRPGIACTGTEEVTKTFRFVASLFADVRSYEWDLLVFEVSEDVAYTVAIERCTASCNSRPPASTELPVTHVYSARGRPVGVVHRDLKPRDQPAGT